MFIRQITPLHKRSFVRGVSSDGYLIIRIIASGKTADGVREYPDAVLRAAVPEMANALLLEGHLQQSQVAERSDSFPLEKVIGAIVGGCVSYEDDLPEFEPGIYALARLYGEHKNKAYRWAEIQYGVGINADVMLDSDEKSGDAGTVMALRNIDSVNIVTNPNAGGRIIGFSEVYIGPAEMLSILSGKKRNIKWWLRTAAHCVKEWLANWAIWLIIAAIAGFVAAVTELLVSKLSGG